MSDQGIVWHEDGVNYTVLQPNGWVTSFKRQPNHPEPVVMAQAVWRKGRWWVTMAHGAPTDDWGKVPPEEDDEG